MKIALICLILLPAVCLAGEVRIIGGEEAATGAWPWQLSQRNAGSHSCGASLISPTHALTAAHCVGGSTLLQYGIVAGTNQRSCPNDQCELRGVASITRHAGFVQDGNEGFPNDIAVIEFDAAINEVSGSIQFASLLRNTDTDYPVDRTCFITGWGRTQTGIIGGSLPENLMQAEVNILSVSECQTMWSSVPVTDLQVCVFDRVDESSGACNGDSGGPLVCQEDDGSWSLVGATSWGRSGCHTDFPSVYTRVSGYIDWITANVPDLP